MARSSGGGAPCPTYVVTEEIADAEPAYLHCYCQRLSGTALLSSTSCRAYLDKKSLAFVLTIVASFSVRLQLQYTRLHMLVTSWPVFGGVRVPSEC